jgi:hypothetical protein
MPRRLYIYRRGATDEYAVTVEKKTLHLPRSIAPDSWQFWMQIGPLQAQNGALGFNVYAAVQAIRADGFHLFRRSKAMADDVRLDPNTRLGKGLCNA